MITRRSLSGLAPLFTIALFEIAACSGGSHALRPNGEVTLRVVDEIGSPVPNATVVATRGDTVVARAVTGILGTAQLGVVTGGEVTAVVFVPQHGAFLVTMFDVSNSGTIELPIASLPSPGPGIGVLVTSTGYAGAASVRASDCATQALINTSASLALQPWCFAQDGTLSISANFSGGSAGFALDVLPPGGAAPIPIALAPTSGFIALPFAWSASNLPISPPSLETFGASALRKGRRLGPLAHGTGLSLASVSGGLDARAPAGTFDGVELDVHLEFGLVGPGDASAGATAYRSTDIDIALDGSVIPGIPGGLTFAPAGETFGLTITDPGEQAFDTAVTLYWNDATPTSHAWSVFFRPPTAAGMREKTLPRLPGDLQSFVMGLDASASWCAGYNWTDVVSDFSARPEPQLLSPVAGDGSYAFSSLCSF